MRKLFFTSFIFVLIVSVCSACSNDDTPPPTPQGISLPVSGAYAWEFEIPGLGEEVATINFSNELIDYKMEGKALNNAYQMIPESYDAKEKRIVAVGKGGEGKFKKDGVYFVMFLKEIKENSVIIYKKQCKTKQEAYDFPVPHADATTDHGWNLFEKKK